MKKLPVLLVKNPECNKDCSGRMLKEMGYTVAQVSSAFEATHASREMSKVGAAYEVVIIDGFSEGDAELIACEMRATDGVIYIGIMSVEAHHPVAGKYADEVIPKKCTALKNALEQRCSVRGSVVDQQGLIGSEERQMKKILVVGDGREIGLVLEILTREDCEVEWALDEFDALKYMDGSVEYDFIVICAKGGLANADQLAFELKMEAGNMPIMIGVQEGFTTGSVKGDIGLGNIDKIITDFTPEEVQKIFGVDESTWK